MEMSVGRDLTLTIALSFQNHFILSLEYVREHSIQRQI